MNNPTATVRTNLKVLFYLQQICPYTYPATVRDLHLLQQFQTHTYPSIRNSMKSHYKIKALFTGAFFVFSWMLLGGFLFLCLLLLAKMFKIGSNSLNFKRKRFSSIIYHKIKKLLNFGVFGRVCVLYLFACVLE